MLDLEVYGCCSLPYCWRRAVWAKSYSYAGGQYLRKLSISQKGCGLYCEKNSTTSRSSVEWPPLSLLLELQQCFACPCVFAEQSGLEELRDISLYKLLYMLHDFPFHTERIGDIIQLARFVFDSESGACANLKVLTLHYMALHIKPLLHDEEFQLLLQELLSLNRLVLNTLWFSMNVLRHQVLALEFLAIGSCFLLWGHYI